MSGNCSTCHWFDPMKGTEGGYCMLNPPRVMLLPGQPQNQGKVLAPGQQPQASFVVQAMYPAVLGAARCQHHKPQLSVH